MDNHSSELMPNPNPTSTAASFIPPRHWVGMEELTADYWTDPKTKEKRGQEFHEKPIEFLEQLDKSGQAGIARRDFLTVMGASMAMASFACARRPVHKIIPYVVKPEEITPGVPNYYASTCQECSNACGVVVKTREGRPIKLEGNPDHPMNRGALCARGQASILNLYDPDRLTAPVTHARGDRTRREISWADADSAIAAKLRAIAAGPGRVRILSGEMSSESSRRLVKEFLGAFRAGAHVEYEPLALEDVASGQNAAYGTAVIPSYAFDQAELVLALGADFLGTWGPSVEQASSWIKRRKLAGKTGAQAMSKLVCFEPTMTVTGANADERYPIRPGDEVKIALALAYELIVAAKKSRFAGEAAVQAALGGYTPEAVAEEIGLEGGAGKIRKLAHALWDAKGKSLVVAGGPQSQTQDAIGLQVAVNLLNSALENEGVTIDGTGSYKPFRGGVTAMTQLIADMKAGAVDALIVYRSNPAFTFPRSVSGFDDALKQVPLVIAVNDRDDETALLADYVLPDHHYLEGWGDSNPRRGLYSLQQPTIAPIHSTRAFQDGLLTWIKGAGLKASGLAARVAAAPAEANTWHDYLQANWKESLFSGSAGSFEQFWEGVLRTGVFETRVAHGSARTFKTTALAHLPKFEAAKGILLSLYASVSLADGRSANNAWLQELPHPISSVTWDNYLNVGPVLAKKLGLAEDDVVDVSLGDVAVELPIHVQPGMHPSAVSVAVGYGRRSCGKVGDQAGVDVYPLARLAKGQLAYSGQTVTLRKTGRFYRLAATQWHTVTEERPIINDITLAEFQKNPAAANHTDPHLRLETVPTMWPTHEYKGYRWGMAIDLTSCIGCSACMIACQAENNIPVVGRDQVRVSRQMHWIRIDRYYSGSPENPGVVFQPMLCQHCENAPCETVCPVLATVHDDEGLNVQVYNRCVGTRYCQNNCPYKVRRFNFFDHWKSYEGTMNLVWNPDVTVRSRGIMEKCTFCVQRIREAKDKAKDAKDKVQDGDLKAACQQTCPTDAIVFGNINDPASRVSRLRADPRAFRVLEVLNTKPVISYLTKVRNSSHESKEG